jgi:hypothetical protein
LLSDYCNPDFLPELLAVLQDFFLFFFAIHSIALFNLCVASETGGIISHSAFPETSFVSKLRPNNVYLRVYAKTWDLCFVFRNTRM